MTTQLSLPAIPIETDAGFLRRWEREFHQVQIKSADPHIDLVFWRQFEIDRRIDQQGLIRWIDEMNIQFDPLVLFQTERVSRKQVEPVAIPLRKIIVNPLG